MVIFRPKKDKHGLFLAFTVVAGLLATLFTITSLLLYLTIAFPPESVYYLGSAIIALHLIDYFVTIKAIKNREAKEVNLIPMLITKLFRGHFEFIILFSLPILVLIIWANRDAPRNLLAIVIIFVFIAIFGIIRYFTKKPVRDRGKVL
jgi:hypothetical protein